MIPLVLSSFSDDYTEQKAAGKHTLQLCLSVCLSVCLQEDLCLSDTLSFSFFLCLSLSVCVTVLAGQIVNRGLASHLYPCLVKSVQSVGLLLLLLFVVVVIIAHMIACVSMLVVS